MAKETAIKRLALHYVRRNGEWEKNRRERFNLRFFELSKLLPDHDPTISLTKVDILNKSIAYIKELQNKNANLIESHCSDPLKSEIISLKQQLIELRKRNRQLADLLQTAEISLPSLPPPPQPFTPPRKWVGRVTKQPTSCIKSDAQEKKETNLKEKLTTPKAPVKRKPAKIKMKAKTIKPAKPKPTSKALPQKKPNVVESKCVTSLSAPLHPITPNQNQPNNTQPKPITSVPVYPQTVTLPCTTISLVLSNPKTNLVTVPKSTILTAPIMTTEIQPVLQRNPTLRTLGPGTLIMPDGRIMPVPPAPQTVLATATQIIVNRPSSQPAVIVMQNIGTIKPVQKNQLRPIVPKLIQRDITKTTFVNKVPIPAISIHNFTKKILSSTVVKKKLPKRKDNTKNNTEKKTVIGKASVVKEKAVVNEVSQKSDKPVVVELHKNNTLEAVKVIDLNSFEKGNCNNSNSNSNSEHALKTSELIGDNIQKEQNLNTVKRKISENDDNIQNAKHKKIDENIDYSNVQVSQNVDLIKLSNQKPENNEKYSINALCTHANVKETNFGKDTTTTSVNNIMEKEIVMNPQKQNNTVNEIIKGNKDKHPTESNVAENKEVKMANISNAQKTINEKCQFSSNNPQNSKTNSAEETNKNPTENVNSSILQNSKFTQITTVQLVCPGIVKNSNENNPVQILQQKTAGIDTKKPIDTGKKSNPENKTTIHDENQEITSLFPTDPKLQTCTENIFRDTDFRDRNLFLPIGHSYMDEVRLSLPHSDFSNDLFSSLQVPTGGQHPESISPTAAFLLAFPLVSTSKTSELIAENDAGESQHATPTTILQIGNIDPPDSELYHQTSLMVDNSVTDLQDTMKLNKSDNIKDNSSKQLKAVEHFNKFQHLEMNDLIRNDNFSRNNCKEKKNCTGLQEQDIFLPCNKKKSNGRTCDYPLPSEVMSHFQDKPFEFPSSNIRHNTVQNNSVAHGRQGTGSNNQKKSQIIEQNLINPQNTYLTSSQPYVYNAFSSGNDFSLPNSNYPTNRSGNETSKSSQTSANFNAISWSSPSSTATVNRTDYTAPYCAYPQKPYTNVSNKSMQQKIHQNNYEDQRLKEKSISSNNMLPKFSTNFQFNSNNRPSLEVHSYPQTNQADNMNYKLESKTKKQKTNSQKTPVNWMTTPDIRPVVPDPNLAPALSDVMFQPQKDLDFNSNPNNIMLSTSNNITPFNISSSMPNNPQTFYPNSHFSGIDLQLDFAPFPEITSSSKSSRTLTTVSGCQQNPHHYSWSPSKSSIPLLPHIDNHMIPSTLPTLVGDLALGTTTPSGPVDTFRNLSMATTPFNIENSAKKCDTKHDSQKTIVGKSLEKECFSNSERRNNNRNIPDYCQKTHSHQSTNTTSSFLSVSQLVDQVKSEQTSSRRVGKQSVAIKSNTSIIKRNLNSHQTDKSNLTKIPNNLPNNPNNYRPSNPINTGMVNQRKPDIHSGYQDHNTTVGFQSEFANNVGPPPWQNDKPLRSTSQYKGNYSAESLIGEHTAPPPQDHVAELPPFSMGNQFPNQYSHSQKPFLDTSIVSSSSYSSAEFSHQNMQPLEFHQSHHPHQNCFNFPSHNSHYSSAPFNPENDYHIGLDPLYSFNHSSTRNSTSCQTNSHSTSKDNRNVSSKRNNPPKRREEFPSQPMQFLQNPQVYPLGTRSKGPLPPPQCPTTSSPSHQSTTTLTNFNLSTIFPEINDKRAVQGSNTFHTSGSKHSDSSVARPTGRSDYSVTNFNPSVAPQMQQVGVTAPPHFPPVNFANLGPSAGNFRPQ